jgi:hypothetical protein
MAFDFARLSWNQTVPECGGWNITDAKDCTSAGVPTLPEMVVFE